MSNTKYDSSGKEQTDDCVCRDIYLSMNMVRGLNTSPISLFNSKPYQMSCNARITGGGITNADGVKAIKTQSADFTSRNFLGVSSARCCCNPNRNRMVAGSNFKNKLGIKFFDSIPSNFPSVKRVNNFNSFIGQYQVGPLQNAVDYKVRQENPKRGFYTEQNITREKSLNSKSGSECVEAPSKNYILDRSKISNINHVSTSQQNGEYIHV